jgi:carboxymethylenebutenolidase
MGHSVAITAADGGTFTGYLSRPASGRAPGIVLIQEIFGVNQVMRGIADWYAARGFAVLCPDLFWRQQPGIELTDRTPQEWQQGVALMKGMDEKAAMGDLAAALEMLRTGPDAAGRAGCLGYCMGGRLAYLMSARHGPDCAVGYYGVGIETRLGEAPGIRTPLMLHIAGRDTHCPVPAQVQIHQALDNHPFVTLHVYRDNDHAFARPGGEHHDPAAAELADLRTLEFFVRHLQGGPIG